MRTMKLADIKITRNFKETTPSEYKIAECRNNYLKYGKQDRYIVVTPKRWLIDGYVFYLVAQEFGIEDVQVKISHTKKRRWRRKNVSAWDTDDKFTTYIYGIHEGGSKKEYVWKVPKEWIGWENDLLLGDKIVVDTKKGQSVVTVTKITRLEKRPVNRGVRKVVAKCGKYDEQ